MSQLVYFAFRKNNNLEGEELLDGDNHIIFMYFYRSSPFYQKFREEVGWNPEWRELDYETLRETRDEVKAELRQYRKKVQTMQSITVSSPEVFAEVYSELESYNEEIADLEFVLKNIDCLLTLYEATKNQDPIYYVFD